MCCDRELGLDVDAVELVCEVKAAMSEAGCQWRIRKITIYWLL